jgi:hypothetical protein
MSKKSKMTMNAVLLRTLLSVSILLIIAVASAGFLFGLGIIKGYAVEVSHKKVDAEASNGNIQALERIKKELNQNSDILNKVGLLKSDSQFPEFRIVDEIKKIAANNNLTIDSFTYSDTAAATGTTPASGSTTTTPPAASTTTPATGTATAGAKTVSLSVTLKAPITYNNFLQFTYDIEQNLPKMKLKGISISAGGGTQSTDKAAVDPNQVSVEPITVEMYIN